MGNSLGPRIIDRFQPARLVVEVAQVVVHERDEPDALAHLFDAHLLSGKDLAHVDLPTLPANPPARCNDGGPIVKGVLELVEPLIAARGRTIATGRRLHVERLMRALVVKALRESVETRLLLKDRRLRGPRGFRLQRKVQPLMSPVLLRVPGGDPLEPNPEA